MLKYQELCHILIMKLMGFGIDAAVVSGSCVGGGWI
jgi:hypothetical protein